MFTDAMEVVDMYTPGASYSSPTGKPAANKLQFFQCGSEHSCRLILQIGSYLPHIEENDTDINPRQRVMEILDNLENHVEKLRKDAAKLEEERDTIMGSLDAVKLLPILNDLTGLDRDEAQQYLERIIDRIHTVSVSVYTLRDKTQEDALHQVNQQIDNLVVLLKVDHEAARLRCLTFMNSCSSQSNGHTDKLFESALLGCTIDDQKRVKKRLLGLLKYLDKMGIVSEV